MKKFLIWLGKLALSLSVIGFLLWSAQRNKSFGPLLEQPKNWTLIALAGFAALLTLVIQFFRWRVLVLALGLRMSRYDTLRLGFLAQLFSFLGAGMLGGDALKTYFLGRQNQGRITEALTTVFIDRVVGLYGLLVLAGGICLVFDPTSLATTSSPTERALVLNLCRIAPWAALASTLALGAMMLPGVTTWSAWDALADVPRIGPSIQKLVHAMRMYRKSWPYVLLAVVITLAIHVCNSLVFLFISQGLPAFDGETPIAKPSFIAHITVALLALASGALPLGGLELVFDILYRGVSGPLMPKEQGLFIVLTFRLLQMCIASIGLTFYLIGRREVDHAMHEVKEAENAKVDQDGNCQ